MDSSVYIKAMAFLHVLVALMSVRSAFGANIYTESLGSNRGPYRNQIVRAGPFVGPEYMGVVTDHRINEASGLAASRTHPGLLYTVNDHGGDNILWAVNASTGATMAALTINGAHNEDWEDVAVGNCNGHSCVYIGDTGEAGDAQIIYRVREPDLLTDQTLHLDGELKYRWDVPDAETVMVDPDGVVYIVSKVHPGHHPKIAQLPTSAWNSHHRYHVEHSATVLVTSDHNDPMGGDISPDGSEVLIKTDKHVYYWDNVHNDDYITVLSNRSPQEVVYEREPKGESVCFDPKGQGYYTISEGHGQTIRYYKRTTEIVG